MQGEVLLWTSSKYPGSESRLFRVSINYGCSPDFRSRSILRDSYRSAPACVFHGPCVLLVRPIMQTKQIRPIRGIAIRTQMKSMFIPPRGIKNQSAGPSRHGPSYHLEVT